MFACEEMPAPANDNDPECPQCGAPFAFREGKKFCSRACKKRYGDAHRDRTKNAPEHECIGCGVTFKRKPNSHDAAKYCSRECAFGNNVQGRLVSAENREIALSFLVSYLVRRNKCQDCGVWVTSPQGRLRCEACDTVHKRNRQDELRGVDRSERACPECSIVFVPPYGRGSASYCSNECSSKRSRRISRSRRKARERGAANDNLDPLSVLERDGWRCQFCGIKTPKRLRGTIELNAPELDHIIPLSLGGEHSARNTQCLCRKCNGEKSNNILGQLRLFG